MKNQDLNKHLALLESKVDQLETELENLNSLLIECGFPEGVETLKSAVEEILEDSLKQIYPKS